MLGGLKLQSCAFGVRVATTIVSGYMLPHLCVSAKFISRMELADEAAILKEVISFYYGDVLVTVVVRRDKLSAAWCLTPALWTLLKSSLGKQGHHRARQSMLWHRLRILLSELGFVRMVSELFQDCNSSGARTRFWPGTLFSWSCIVFPSHLVRVTSIRLVWRYPQVVFVVGQSRLSVTSVRVEGITSAWAGKCDDLWSDKGIFQRIWCFRTSVLRNPNVSGCLFCKRLFSGPASRPK